MGNSRNLQEVEVAEVELPDGTTVYYNEKTLEAYDAAGEPLGKYDPKTQKVQKE